MRIPVQVSWGATRPGAFYSSSYFPVSTFAERTPLMKSFHALTFALALTNGSCLVSAEPAGEPFFESQLIEPLNKLHNHGSCITVLPNGDVLASWYKGSGERTEDDVRIVGARLSKGQTKFSEVFELADFPGFPDCNVCAVVDGDGKLWIFWPLIVANQWETAILMARYSTNYEGPGAPVWDWQEPIILKPGDVFAEDVSDGIAEMRAELPPEIATFYDKALTKVEEMAKDKYARRMGWMPRSKPTKLDSGRILLPLYSDGFSFGLVAISDDNGKSWQSSRPILSAGGVQPSIVAKKDGTLVAYMRDNGPPPKRIIESTSTDNGMTWSRGVDGELFDCGAGVEAHRLNNGNWIMLHNDTEKGRHSLAVHLSDDEGASWKWVRHIELVEPEQGSFSYPSFDVDLQGNIHATYSYKKSADGEGETIKYCKFNEAWIRQGDSSGSGAH